MEFQHKVSLSLVSQGILDCESFHKIPPKRQGRWALIYDISVLTFHELFQEEVSITPPVTFWAT